MTLDLPEEREGLSVALGLACWDELRIRAQGIGYSCLKGEAIIGGFGDIPEVFIGGLVFVGRLVTILSEVPQGHVLELAKLRYGVSHRALSTLYGVSQSKSSLRREVGPAVQAGPIAAPSLMEIVMSSSWFFFVDWDRLLVWLRFVRWLDMVARIGLVLVSVPLLWHLVAWGLLWPLWPLLGAMWSWPSLDSAVVDSLAPELC
jgi:hypothetical protein